MTKFTCDCISIASVKPSVRKKYFFYHGLTLASTKGNYYIMSGLYFYNNCVSSIPATLIIFFFTICLFIYLSISLFIYLNLYQSVYLTINLSICMSLSIYLLLFCQYFYLSMYLSVYISIYIYTYIYTYFTCLICT